MNGFIMLVALGAALLEYRKMYRRKHYKEMAIGGTLLFVGLLIGAVKVINNGLPNPTEFIEMLFAPPSLMLQRWLS